MPVVVSKEFRWEMGHRLPYHETCKNIHGHSYRMVVEVEGETGDDGMVVDFGLIACVVKPIVRQLDHSFMLDPTDGLMAGVLETSGLKATRVPFFSTAENIAQWILGQIAPELLQHTTVSSVRLKLYETSTSYAEVVRQR